MIYMHVYYVPCVTKGKLLWNCAFPEPVHGKPFKGFVQLCIDLTHLEPSPGAERDPLDRNCRKEWLYGVGWAIQLGYIAITDISL